MDPVELDQDGVGEPSIYSVDDSAIEIVRFDSGKPALGDNARESPVLF